ncbi:MAG: NAD-dependent epimerase [Planctomycetaceae bacterium]|nr:NAD-dependent epimerase [Planctomycetaceae bacterium]
MPSIRNRRGICLVTGGGGFIGSHIADRLLREDYQVRVLDPYADRSCNLRHLEGQIEIVSATSADEALSRESLEGVDTLFHYAGAVLPAASNDQPVADVLDHLANTLRLFVEAAESGVKTIVFASSGGTVYGIPKKLPISEIHPTNPISSYGVVKLALEKYLAILERKYGLRCIVLRYGNPYGPRQAPSPGFGAVATFAERLANRQPIEIWGDGSVRRDFIYIDDAIDATYNAFRYTGQERVFNIGSGTATSLNDLVTTIQLASGTKAKVVHRQARPSDVPEIALDIGRAERELAWKPKTTLEAGISSTWQWLDRKLVTQRLAG